eukprot:8432783-Karenia_brevis.AAC.1
MRYVIDKLHAKGHTDDWCLANVHPDVPANTELLSGFNSSVCEALNSVIGRHKFMLRHMRGLVGCFFMHEVVESRNVLSRL